MDFLQTLVLLLFLGALVLALSKLFAPTQDSGDLQVDDLATIADGCAVGGDLKDGTWSYAPDNADGKAPGILVLRDTPKVRARVDGQDVELRSGFRGFRAVPPGVHEVVVYGYQAEDKPAAARLKVPAGGCVVLIYEPNPNRLEPDRTYGVQYIPLALSGAMDSALFAWPGKEK